MPRRFRKNPRELIVIVPGHGRVHENDVLEGDQYAQFAPHLLHEIGVTTADPPAAPVPAQEVSVNPVLADALKQAEKDTKPLDLMPPPAPKEDAPVPGDAPSATLTESPPKKAPKAPKGKAAPSAPPPDATTTEG